jgi:hypothetical protein
MPDRALLDLEIHCPWSGIKLKGKVIPVHKVRVMRCANGVLFSICQIHKARTFTADQNTIAEVIQSVNVLEITQKPPPRKSHHS